MSEFQRKPQRFICKGLDVTNPPDAVKPGKYPYLKNVRAYYEGQLSPRSGYPYLDSYFATHTVVSGQTVAHSIKRLTDFIASTYKLVVGIGTHLATGQTSAWVDVDSGYSGDPLALATFRPDQSPQPWMYVADRNRMRKVLSDNTLHQIGIPRPVAPPTTTLGTPHEAVITLPSTCPTLSAPNNATYGTTGSSLFSTTIAAVLYDTGTAGACSVIPTTWAISMAVNLLVNDSTKSEIAAINEVHSALVNTGTVISSFIYDSGSTGLCSVVMSTAYTDVAVNSVFLHAGSGKYFRVQSVSQGPDGTQSYRFDFGSTVIFLNDVMTPANTFRTFTLTTWAATNTISATYNTFSNAWSTASDVGYADTGHVAIDLSMLSGGIAVQPDDYVSLMIQLSNVNALVQGTFSLNVDIAGVSTPQATDFQNNYYYKDFIPSDLTAAVAGTDTSRNVKRNIIAGGIIDGTRPIGNQDPYNATGAGTNTGGPTFAGNATTSLPVSLAATTPTLTPNFNQDPFPPPGGPKPPGGPTGPPGGGNPPTLPPPTGGTRKHGIQRPIAPGRQHPIHDPAPDPTQFVTGSSQWFSASFRIGDFTRVGADLTRTLANVNNVRIAFKTTANETIGITSFWVGSGSGPDSIVGSPYFYRYRARCSATGVKSNPSPPTRGGIDAARQSINVTIPAYTAQTGYAAEVDRLDIERLGGLVQNWQYLASINTSAGGTYIDKFSDTIILDDAPMDPVTSFQLWPIIDVPRSGTCLTSGTSITSAAQFNLAWAPGTIIQVAGVSYTVYNVPTTSLLQTFENTGPNNSGVAWQIPEPVLLGQPLPCFWGPFNGVFFGCGSALNPGTLFWTNTNDPDTTVDTFRLEVTSPSEPLMNGCLYNGRCYVWSSDRMFEISPGAGIPQVNEIPGGYGLYSRWSFAVGPQIFYLGRDGVYITEGGVSQSISYGDLRSLFSFEGRVSTPTVNSIPTVGTQLTTVANAADFRMCYDSGYLYFEYNNGFSGGSLARGTLVYEPAKDAWWFDTGAYACRYNNEGLGLSGGNQPGQANNQLILGGVDGKLYFASGAVDAVAGVVSMAFQTGFTDLGEPREEKLFGDLFLDYDSGGQNAIVAVYFDNSASATATSTVVAGPGRGTDVIDLSSGAGIEGRSISISVTMDNSNLPLPYFYLWEPTFIPRPDITYLRGTDIDDQGFAGRKYVRGITIEADTGGIARSIQIMKDGAAVAATLSINNNGKSTVTYSFTPFDTFELWLLTNPIDSGTWKLYKYEFIFDKYPALAELVTSWDAIGTDRAKWVQGMRLKADTAGVNATIQVQSDGAAVQETIVVNHPGQIVIPYSWTPFITHELRIVPTAGTIGIFDVDWVWEPEPELTTTWVTQATTHDFQGFLHAKEAYIALRSSATVTLTVTIDGTAYTYTIPSTSGNHRKNFVQLQAIKGKLFQYSLTSAQGFRLYQKDCAVSVKSWGKQSVWGLASLAYTTVNPFGDVSRQQGAAI